MANDRRRLGSEHNPTMHIVPRGRTRSGCIAMACLAVWSPSFAQSSLPASQPPRVLKGGINSDAMTVDDCRRRLALPKRERPSDPDPRVDLDAVCRNILDATAPGASAPKRKAAASEARR